MIIIQVINTSKKATNSFLNILLPDNIIEYTDQYLNLTKNFEANLENTNI